MLKFILYLCLCSISIHSYAQIKNQAQNNTLPLQTEEIVIIGSHFSNSDNILPKRTLNQQQLSLLDTVSGDELINLMPEHGQNFYSEAENVFAGINVIRGDIGGYNLRHLGTGNTLVLINHRRMVNSASYQTEEVGGSEVPVNSVNSKTIAVGNLNGFQVLTQGAAAIYGADSVAGAINHITDTTFNGVQFSINGKSFNALQRQDHQFQVKIGTALFAQKGKLNVYFEQFNRSPVQANEQNRWLNADYSRNYSSNSHYGQFDVVEPLDADNNLMSNGIVDISGEFEVYPLADSRCIGGIALNEQLCMRADGQGTIKYNRNINRDLIADLQRNHLQLYFTYQLDMAELFSEILWYKSNTTLNRDPASSIPSVKLRLAANHYYNPLGAIGSAYRISDPEISQDIPDAGLELIIDNYRFVEASRKVQNNGETYRILQGIKGKTQHWKWEGAVTYSQANKQDVTNRISNSLLREALNDPTANAYNPFVEGIDSNIERVIIDVSRKGKTELSMVDFKFIQRNPIVKDNYSINFLFGGEWRKETFLDDFDPRLDGTINFIDYEGDTFPLVSDVVGSSPTPDTYLSRQVFSLHSELSVDLGDNINLQSAIRYENYDNGDAPFVGQVAIKYAPMSKLHFHAAYSQTYRAPNLVTLSPIGITRSWRPDDYVCHYINDIIDNATLADLECNYTMNSVAHGHPTLKAETADNIAIGLTADLTNALSVGLNLWSIQKENTIGLLGLENHTLYELLLLLSHTGDCNTLNDYSPVVRQTPTDEQLAAFNLAEVCPLGSISEVNDNYANLAKRQIKGMDISLTYTENFSLGNLSMIVDYVKINEYYQDLSGNAQDIVDAIQTGDIAINYPVSGFNNLLGINGIVEEKWFLRTIWQRDNYTAGFNVQYIGPFTQQNFDGSLLGIDSMTILEANFNYQIDTNNVHYLFKLSLKNLTDELAPTANREFGYYADVHNDFGQSINFGIQITL